MAEVQRVYVVVKTVEQSRGLFKIRATKSEAMEVIAKLEQFDAFGDAYTFVIDAHS